MSRSTKHTPIQGNTTCRSEKSDKQKAHRKLRAAVRSSQDEERPLPHMREVSNISSFGKDGKSYRKSMNMRK